MNPEIRPDLPFFQQPRAGGVVVDVMVDRLQCFGLTDEMVIKPAFPSHPGRVPHTGLEPANPSTQGKRLTQRANQMNMVWHQDQRMNHRNSVDLRNADFFKTSLPDPIACQQRLPTFGAERQKIQPARNTEPPLPQRLLSRTFHHGNLPTTQETSTPYERAGRATAFGWKAPLRPIARPARSYTNAHETRHLLFAC